MPYATLPLETKKYFCTSVFRENSPRLLTNATVVPETRFHEICFGVGIFFKNSFLFGLLRFQQNYPTRKQGKVEEPANDETHLETSFMFLGRANERESMFPRRVTH